MRLSAGLTPFLHFLYPAFCLHCGGDVESPDQLLCSCCFSFIEWLNPHPCCPLCAVPLGGKGAGRCFSCRRAPLSLQPHASVFSPQGPIIDLFYAFQARPTTQLAKLFASFFVIFLNRLPWPFPDVIVPIPDSRIGTWSKSKQGNLWIAKELAQLLNLSLCFPFKHGATLSLKKHARPLPEKRVLLLTADLKQGALIQRAKQLLRTLFTKHIYSLALIEKRKNEET